MPSGLMTVLPLALVCVATAAHGASWQILPNAPVASRHNDLCFIDPLRGWAVNTSGQVWRTTNGGDGWEQQLQVASRLRSLYFADDQLGFAGSINNAGDGVLFRTTNGGVSWTRIDSLIPQPRPAGLCGITGVEDFVFGSGRFNGPPVVIRSTDRGVTWSSMNLSAHVVNLIDCHFVTPDTGFVVGGFLQGISSAPRVLSTFDGGQTWQTRYTGNLSFDGAYCWKIFFVDRLLGYVSVETPTSPNVLKTTDGGLTWSEKTVPGVLFLQGIGFATPTLGWVDGFSGASRMTTDGGDTWQPVVLGEVEPDINRFQMFSPTLGYAAGRTIYKYSETAGVIAEGPVRAPQLGLAIYPNPFGESTTIQYVVPTGGEVSVQLYDVLGRHVRTLVRGEQAAGRQEVRWDGNSDAGTRMSAGQYILRVDASGDAESRSVLRLP